MTQTNLLPKDWREFFELLNVNNVEYLVVGGFAVAFHGRPRYTDDIDLLFRSTPENAQRLESTIRQFGFGSLGITNQDLQTPDQIIQLGYPPNRIDLINSISGVASEEAWASRVAGDLDGIPVFFISKEALIRNKRASGRTKDLADLDSLGAS